MKILVIITLTGVVLHRQVVPEEMSVKNFDPEIDNVKNWKKTSIRRARAVIDFLKQIVKDSIVRSLSLPAPVNYFNTEN